MNIKTLISHLALTTGAAAFTWMISAGAFIAIAGIELPPHGPDELMSPIGGLLLLVLVLVGLSTWMVYRSQLLGRQLGMQVFAVTFGVMFFMTQMETLAFNSAVAMPWQIIASTVGAGLLVCLVVAGMSMRLKRRVGVPPGIAPAAPRTFGQRVVRSSFVAALYVVLYFLSGYYIAWQFPALREFYSGSTELLSFYGQMQAVLEADAWLVPFQLLRGYAWTGLGCLALVGLRSTGRLERYLLVGLLLSLPLAVPLLVPQGYMPMAVRIGHFPEVFLENFLLGCAVVAALGPRRADG